MDSFKFSLIYNTLSTEVKHLTFTAFLEAWLDLELIYKYIMEQLKLV